MTDLSVTQYFSYWRSIARGNREIVEGLVAPEHRGPSPALARAVAGWDGHHYWEETREGRWLILVREAVRPRERWWLHAALLLLTLVATSIGGAILAGEPGAWYRPTAGEVVAGLPFSLPLMAILLAHESGHYVAARRYRVDASPPFFIPFPPQWNLLGTLGAFIRLRSFVLDRRTLFDIGSAGPIAGIAIALPVLILGLASSEATRAVAPLPLAHQYIELPGIRLWLGDSLLLWLARTGLGLDGAVRLVPLAVAGWVGLFVTFLNLLPLAQLDGGHISYALFGRRQRWIALGFWVLLLPLGFYWPGWWLWAVLALVLGRGRLEHPPLTSGARALGPTRRLVGYATIALFALTFMPLPFSAGGG